jgi:hypothetical protein
MKKTLRILLLLLTWIVFPPVYVYLIFKNENLEKRSKIGAYISVIISPFTLCLIGLTAFLIIFHQPSKFSVDTMEETLNIKISNDYDVEKNTIVYSGQDYNANIILKLSEKSIKDITSQIEKSPFFNLQHDFYGNNEIEWQKSDTLLYWKVRNYLEKKHLTGYWVKKDDVTYEFYSPALSDIPNSAILFHEGFIINASISLKDKILNYKYNKL